MMNITPLVIYAAAMVAYGWHFTERNPMVGRTATTLLIFAALAHTFVIGMLTMDVGHVPVAGATSAISTFVWLLALAYLYTEMATDAPAPASDDEVLASLGMSLTDRGIGELRAACARIARRIHGEKLRVVGFVPSDDKVAVPPLFGVHVSSLLFAYASFALACVIGVTYVLLFKEIKAKHLGFFYARLPSLQVLDRMNHVAIVVGWVFLTIGIIVGAIWAAQAQGGYAGDPRVQAMSLKDPKIIVALVCWLVYSFELFAARRIGWGGRRAAYLSTLGFVIVLLNFVPISYFFTQSHNF